MNVLEKQQLLRLCELLNKFFSENKNFSSNQKWNQISRKKLDENLAKYFLQKYEGRNLQVIYRVKCDGNNFSIVSQTIGLNAVVLKSLNKLNSPYIELNFLDDKF